MDKTIVVLGSGIGGIVAARELRRHLGAQHRILLIDREPALSFPPSFLWVMIGWRTPAAITKILSLVERYGIEYRRGVVEEISTAGRTVRIGAETISFDYLVVALGAEPDQGRGIIPSGKPSSFYTLSGAEEISTRIGSLRNGTVSIIIGGLPYRCPPAPYEAAFLLDSYFRRRSAGMAIRIVTPEADPLSGLGSPIGAALRKILTERSIEIQTGCITDDGADADLRLFVPPVKTPRVVTEAGLTDRTGWIPVDRATLETAHENIFAIGDVTRIPVGGGFELPKVGIFAADQGEVVAHIIARRIHQREAAKQFNGAGYCFLETGNGRAGYIHADFYALPEPRFVIHEPSVGYHWAKVVFEKYWLWRWF
jgi:sulfide:quinone oxidoreductase